MLANSTSSASPIALDDASSPSSADAMVATTADKLRTHAPKNDEDDDEDEDEL
jgi:hypothetical protein